MSAQASVRESLPTVHTETSYGGWGPGEARPWNLSGIPGNSGVLCLRAALLQSHDGEITGSGVASPGQTLKPVWDLSVAWIMRVIQTPTVSIVNHSSECRVEGRITLNPALFLSHFLCGFLSLFFFLF